jgi:Nickel responsive protein SCO4226-like
VQEKYRVKYLRYLYDEGTGTVFCLCDAPNKEAAQAVHYEAHGLVTDEIIEVKDSA